MTEANFTPGPWYHKWPDTDWGFIRKAGQNGPIARVCVAYDPDPENDEARKTDTEPKPVAANAHLIAAAPDLYASLNDIVNPSKAESLDKVYLRAQAALAKARGETT